MNFFRENVTFIPFSGNLWGARASCTPWPCAPPLTPPLVHSTMYYVLLFYDDFWVNQTISREFGYLKVINSIGQAQIFFVNFPSNQRFRKELCCKLIWQKDLRASEFLVFPLCVKRRVDFTKYFRYSYFFPSKQYT